MCNQKNIEQHFQPLIPVHKPRQVGTQARKYSMLLNRLKPSILLHNTTVILQRNETQPLKLRRGVRGTRLDTRSGLRRRRHRPAPRKLLRSNLPAPFRQQWQDTLKVLRGMERALPQYIGKAQASKVTISQLIAYFTT